MFSWPNTSLYQFSSRSRTFEITAATEHRAERAVTRSGLFISFWAKRRIQRIAEIYANLRGERDVKTTNLRKRCVVLLRSEQKVLQFCFTDSEARLDDKVRFVNLINSLDNISACGLMKSRKAFGTSVELQRPGMPSKNSWSSPSSFIDLNVHNNARMSISW
jgi:hypothetical protein